MMTMMMIKKFFFSLSTNESLDGDEHEYFCHKNFILASLYLYIFKLLLLLLLIFESGAQMIKIKYNDDDTILGFFLSWGKNIEYISIIVIENMKNNQKKTNLV